MQPVYDHAGIQLFCGDALEVLRSLPDESVHACVSSPPYYGLRDYQTGTWEGGDPECEHRETDRRNGRAKGTFHGGDDTAQTHVYRSVCGRCGAVRVDQQIGLEETVDAYIARLVEVFADVRRVLHKSGVLFVNIGDSYNGSGGAGGDYGPGGLKEGQPKYPGRREGGLKPKDLIGVPWRLAFALQDDGWWLRQDLVWAKPNVMPESVTDRCTRSHEYIFLLAKAERYFFDNEAIKEPQCPSTLTHAPRVAIGPKGTDPMGNNGKSSGRVNDVGGRNRRSVWTIPTGSFEGAHFATFPPALVEPMILSGTSAAGCCPRCLAPYRRVVEKTGHVNRREAAHQPGNTATKVDSTGWAPTTKATDQWQAGCDCGAGPAIPCTVLDPFVGGGTAVAVAKRLGRHGLGVDLSREYLKLAERRLHQDVLPLEVV